MNRLWSNRWLAIVALVAVFALPTRADDEEKVDLPTSKKDLLELMIRMLGDERVPISERGKVQNLIMRTDDRGALIDVLIAHLDDDRTFDPAMPVPSADSPSHATYVCTVGDICGDMLRSKFHMHPRGKYEVGEWKEWWKKNSSRSFEDIWKEVEAAGHH